MPVDVIARQGLENGGVSVFEFEPPGLGGDASLVEKEAVVADYAAFNELFNRAAQIEDGTGTIWDNANWFAQAMNAHEITLGRMTADTGNNVAYGPHRLVGDSEHEAIILAMTFTHGLAERTNEVEPQQLAEAIGKLRQLYEKRQESGYQSVASPSDAMRMAYTAETQFIATGRVEQAPMPRRVKYVYDVVTGFPRPATPADDLERLETQSEFGSLQTIAEERIASLLAAGEAEHVPFLSTIAEVQAAMANIGTRSGVVVGSGEETSLWRGRGWKTMDIDPSNGADLTGDAVNMGRSFEQGSLDFIVTAGLPGLASEVGVDYFQLAETIENLLVPGGIAVFDMIHSPGGDGTPNARELGEKLEDMGMEVVVASQEPSNQADFIAGTNSSVKVQVFARKKR